MRQLIVTLVLLCRLFSQPTVTKEALPFDIPPGQSVCNLRLRDGSGNPVVVIPCRYPDELPVVIPPVEVNCNDMNSFGSGDKNRCTNVV